MSNSRKNESVTYKLNIDIACGLLTGVFCTAVFNPWDRALFLSVSNNRPFLRRDNFINPYQGVYPALMQRAFLGSIYYVLVAQLKDYLYPYLRQTIGLNEPAAQFCVGTTAGGLGGVLTNSISSIKSYTWGNNTRTFLLSAREMWSHGGYKPFVKGTAATVGRDVVFGGTYEMLRHVLRSAIATSQQDKTPEINSRYSNMVCDGVAAGVATVTAGPINYARILIFNTAPNLKPPSVRQALSTVWAETKKCNQTRLEQLSYLARRFGVGWGTARVTVGMAVGQQLFDWSRARVNEFCSDSPQKRY